MQIRPFIESDEAAVIALWQECGLTRPWNDPHKDIARKLRVQRELFLVATEDDRLIGSVMAGYEGHRGWVNYLAVSPPGRGRGLGRELMAHVEALLLERGCPKINLMVRAGNDSVLAFYRRIGYLDDAAVPLGKRLIPDGPGPQT
jgi:ribosomal protein S18 acetylase RimI-like enzyme